MVFPIHPALMYIRSEASPLNNYFDYFPFYIILHHIKYNITTY